MKIDWEEFRNEDKSIDLVSATEFYLDLHDRFLHKDGKEYLKILQEIQPIYSRQVAAIVVTDMYWEYGLQCEEI